jgi:predicted RNA methylase
VTTTYINDEQLDCSTSPQYTSRSALLSLLTALDGDGYDFVPPTPATHARVVARPDRREAQDVRDVLGWSLPVAPRVLPRSLEAGLIDAGVLVPGDNDRLVPQLRVSRVLGTLFWHSRYPTTAHDSVFLGPDSYRFAQFILARMDPAARSILDYGAGAGVGGIIAARRAENAVLTIADINPKALFLASINADHAGVRHRAVKVSQPSDVDGRFDLMVTHPPFMIDSERRAYRDGGELHGAALSLDWVVQGIDLLNPDGRLIMHTGVSIVGGRDVLLDAFRDRLPAVGNDMTYLELDPDIFGDELDQPAYADVDRIAAVGVMVRRTGAA